MGGDADFEHAPLLRKTHVGCRFSSVGHGCCLVVWAFGISDNVPGRSGGFYLILFVLHEIPQQTTTRSSLSLSLLYTLSLHFDISRRGIARHLYIGF